MKNFKYLIGALLIGLISIGYMSALTISPNFTNAVQYIKTIFLTDNGNNTGILGVKIDGNNSEIQATNYSTLSGNIAIQLFGNGNIRTPQITSTNSTIDGLNKVYAPDSNGTMVLVNISTIGDIKQGIQTSDHNGWVKLDGRSLNSLTATQQNAASNLGIGTNLPDATNSYLVQNGNALGSISSSNSRSITQNQLPNVTLGGTTSTDGSHSHSHNANGGAGGYSLIRRSVAGESVTATEADDGNAGTEPDVFSLPIALMINNAGSHNHSITTTSLNGNVAQGTLDITPQSMSVNTFIYLGN